MARLPSTAFPAVSLLILACAAGASARADQALERAKALLDRNDGRGAAAILEEALPVATSESRPQVLQSLRTAYESAIRQAEADGKARDAEMYRENLAILDRKPGGCPNERELPSLATTARRKSAPADVPEVAPSLAADAARRAPEPPVPPPALGAPGDLAAADRAFQAKDFEEAGRIYAALARDGRLPEARHDAWAYCRMYEVVRRINAPPRTGEEWSSIQAEIREIRKLSPKNWYAEYLRNLTLELAPKSKGGRTDSRRVVLRGAAPDEPARTPTPIAESAHPDAVAARVGQPGQAIGNWKVWDTPSFRILHADDALAERVAQIAEAARAHQCQRWMGSAPAGPWAPRCDIYLYPTAAIFQQSTGQPQSSPGFSTMGINAGRVVARRVNLRADHTNLLHTILPHEITHVVLADIFPTQQIPRWADEGMAVLSEPASEQDLRALDLAKPLATGELFKLSDLMAMDYPNGRYWSLYYAQSVSLTRYLVEQGTPAQFVQFVRSAQRTGIENELRRIYKIKGFADLQNRWLTHAKQNNSALAAAKPSSATAASGEARRE
jgi:hypothetical protein